MRLALAALAALLAIAVVAVPTSARVVRGGTVEVGKGAAGVRLGMTRAEVIETLGQPEGKGPRVLGYNSSNFSTLFDVYLEGKEGRPARMISFAGRRFVLPDGTRLFRRGAVRKLKARYGRRLRKVYQRRVGIRTYRVKSRYLGRRVWTDFNVDKFGRDAKILQVFILFPRFAP